MGNKIFVTYKYGDSDVNPLPKYGNQTTVRHYVDQLEDMFGEVNHIYKGESDDEDLSDFKDETIESKIKDKIFDSSLTIVMISPRMKESTGPESDQWIPWEVSYSLRNVKRGDRVKKPSGLLGVVIPDIIGSYEYFLVDKHCSSCNSRLLKTNSLFQILSGNMFNRKVPEYVECLDHPSGSKSQKYGASYIEIVKWTDFIGDHQRYIDVAYSRRENINDYNIVKSV